MTLPALVILFLLALIMLLVGGGVLALLMSHPALSAPLVGAFAAMTLIVTILALLVAAARS